MKKLILVAMLSSLGVANATQVPDTKILKDKDQYDVYVGKTKAEPAKKENDDVKQEVKAEAKAEVKPEVKAEVVEKTQVKMTIRKVRPNEIMQLEKTDPAIEQSKRWQENWVLGSQPGAKPTLTDEGVVRFPYGEYQPVVVCAPLRMCDIELQAGEKLLDVNSSDSVRILVSSAISGTAPNLIQHILIKPTDKGLVADLVITTDKRTYFITVKSANTETVSRVGFYYPKDEARESFERTKKLADTMKAKYDAEQSLKAKEISPKQWTVEALDFEYEMKVKGKPDFKPLRVFNDGKQVYIQFGTDVRTRELPVLTVIDDEGNSQIVNYRIKDNFFVVDRLFKKARVFIGVGDEQQSVDIEYVKGKVSNDNPFSFLSTN